MPLGNNSSLYSAAVNKIFLDANGLNDFFAGTAGADTFIVADGNVGDDTIGNFEKNDSLVTHKKIFDGNNDGIVSFGPNGVLDVDRTSSKNAGPDQLTLTGSSLALRYLGTKEGGTDHVYADASVRLSLAAAVGTVTEGTVGNNTFAGTAGKDIYLYDTALGLNLGGDTITGFGGEDLLVTTFKIFDGNGDDRINFSTNGVLDLATGDETASVSGPNIGQTAGGQIDFGGLTDVYFVGDQTINGVTYFFYGAEPLA